MRRTILNCLLGVVLLVASQACVPQMPVTLDANGIGTAIAGTMAAALTQTAQSGVPVEPTFTVSPTRRPSMTPYPTYTLVVGASNIYVSVATNCRTGPGKAYPSVAAVEVGQAVKVVGRSQDGKYWIILNPDNPKRVCWLWGQYVQMTGIAGILPVMTPPPTPTPKPSKTPTRRPRPPTATSSPTLDFSMSFVNLETCPPTMEWWAEVALTNNSQYTAQSIGLIMVDNDPLAPPPIFYSFFGDDFTNRNGCTDYQTADTIPPGVTQIVSLPVLTYNPAGHPMAVAVSLCSEPAQLGVCGLQVIDFMP